MVRYSFQSLQNDLRSRLRNKTLLGRVPKLHPLKDLHSLKTLDSQPIALFLPLAMHVHNEAQDRENCYKEVGYPLHLLKLNYSLHMLGKRCLAPWQ